MTISAGDLPARRPEIPVFHEPPALSSSVFVIAGSAHAAALRRRLEHDPNITVFSESESLDALRLILEHPPKVLALDSTVVKTARGALIVSHMREHGGVDVRVLTEDEEHLPMLLIHHDLPLHAASLPIEGCGTRGARRVTMKPDVQIVVGGERSELVNLSVTGAQLVLPMRLQPRQGVRLTLIHDGSHWRFHGVVAWSTVQLVKSQVKYRAGIAFVDPPAAAIIDAFCARYGMKSSAAS
jgi:hypothetical protein